MRSKRFFVGLWQEGSVPCAGKTKGPALGRATLLFPQCFRLGGAAINVRATVVSPNSSLKPGPTIPCGKVLRMSPIFLRTWYQMSGIALPGVEPFRLTKIVV